jgi:hypothetical protein
VTAAWEWTEAGSDPSGIRPREWTEAGSDPCGIRPRDIKEMTERDDLIASLTDASGRLSALRGYL